MQVKQETLTCESFSSSHLPSHRPSTVTEVKATKSFSGNQDILSDCSQSPSPSSQQIPDKTFSPYALWAEYFETFPTQTDFDLRSGDSGGAGSTGSSIASSTSSPASSENWSGAESGGSPFSDCDPDESTLTDDHSVPTSVIDEIVQTLIMDGYNFDHLGDGLLDPPHSYHIKQEHDLLEQQSYSRDAVYASLTPPKLQLHLEGSSCQKTYNVLNSDNNNLSTMNNNSCFNNGSVNNMSVFDQMLDEKWCSSTATLPPMSISLQQIQQHNSQLQQQQLHNVHSSHTHQHHIPPQHHSILDPQHQNFYASTPHLPDSTLEYTTPAAASASTAMFSGTYPSLQNTGDSVQQYKYVATNQSSMQSLPPLVQVGEKPADVKPRRRRSNNSSGTNRTEKPHVCTECGAAFKLSANLKQHQVIHTGEKPFSCDICKAMFTRLSSLKTHHRLHTGEKPHICPFCSAAFADRSAMKAHKRIHTGERPYKCATCNTSFTQLSHLNAHKRTHTGEKPYACAICGTTFKQLGHLKRHEKSHVCNRM